MKKFNLDEYLANPNRKVVTRDGSGVRIICTDFYGEKPIIAKIEGCENSYPFYENGRFLSYGEPSDLDLLFAPEKKEGWANIYLCDGEYSLDDVIYPSRIDAEESGKKFEDYLTTIQIEWEE